MVREGGHNWPRRGATAGLGGGPQLAKEGGTVGLGGGHSWPGRGATADSHAMRIIIATRMLTLNRRNSLREALHCVYVSLVNTCTHIAACTVLHCTLNSSTNSINSYTTVKTCQRKCNRSVSTRYTNYSINIRTTCGVYTHAKTVSPSHTQHGSNIHTTVGNAHKTGQYQHPTLNMVYKLHTGRWWTCF